MTFFIKVARLLALGVLLMLTVSTTWKCYHMSSRMPRVDFSHSDVTVALKRRPASGRVGLAY